jgi:hypothetical protein
MQPAVASYKAMSAFATAATYAVGATSSNINACNSNACNMSPLLLMFGMTCHADQLDQHSDTGVGTMQCEHTPVCPVQTFVTQNRSDLLPEPVGQGQKPTTLPLAHGQTTNHYTTLDQNSHTTLGQPISKLQCCLGRCPLAWRCLLHCSCCMLCLPL